MMSVCVRAMLSCFSHVQLFSSVQLLCHVRLFVTQSTAARQASLSITNSRSLLKLTSIESVMTSNHLILCCPLLLLPSIFPLRDPMHHSLPGSSAHVIFQARILEWIFISSSRGSLLFRDWTCISCTPELAGGFFTSHLGSSTINTSVQIVNWF